jgi:hypothetical protein
MAKISNKNKDFFEKKTILKLVTGAGLLATLLFSTPKVEAIDYSYADLLEYYSIGLSEGEIDATYNEIVQLILNANSGTTIYGFAKLEGQALKNYEERFNTAMENIEAIYNLERPLGISWERQTKLTASTLINVEALLNPNPIQKEVFVRDYIVRYQLARRIVSGLALEKEHSMERTVFNSNVHAQNLINASKNYDDFSIVYNEPRAFAPVLAVETFGEKEIRKILRP